MTAEEMSSYTETYKTLETLAEKRAFIAAHIARMKARCRTRGVSIPDTKEWSDVLRRAQIDALVAARDRAAEAADNAEAVEGEEPADDPPDVADHGEDE